MSRGTCAIVGASGGIGRALCARLCAEGVPLALAARGEAALSALAAELGASHAVLDASRDESALSEFLRAAKERHGPLDAVVNLAGSLLLKPAHATSPAEFDETVAQNLRSAFLVVRAAAPLLRQQGGGSIVLLSSAAAAVGLPNHEAIAAAKAGVEGLVRSAAASYARFGVRVNAIAPGLVRTPLTARLLANAAQEEASAAMHALGRVGEPEDVAAAIAWLVSPAAGWVSGQVLGVDGGLARLRVPGR